LFKEFFFQNINFLTVEDLSLPVQIDSITFQNTGGFRKTTSSATMGLEISKKFFSTKNEKLDFLLGASGQIGYHLASYKPKASVFNPHKFFNLFGQINLVPRVSNVINERLSLNVSCFIPVLNIESNRTTIDNPRIPVNQRSQTQINLDIISYFNHLRFGLVYKLAPKK